MLVDRKKEFALECMMEAMNKTDKSIKTRIQKLNENGEALTCPECKSNDHVENAGTNNGIRKFYCGNPTHDKKWFSTTTSLEAEELYRETLVDILCSFVFTNATVEGLQKNHGVSKYMVELALEAMHQYIKKGLRSSKINIEDSTDLATIYFDISGNNLAKNKALILAKIGDKIIFDIITKSHNLGTHQLLKAVKNKLDVPDSTQIVFVTDGEQCFVEPIQEFFPDAIHIRQFHKPSCRGIIYVHLRKDGEYHTVRMLWDVVLDEEEPSEKAKKRREYKARKKLNKKQRKKKVKYTELSKDIMVWKGTVYNPRGIRQRIDEDDTHTKIDGEKTGNENRNKNRNTYPSDGELVFRGELEEAKKLEIVSGCFNVLKSLFGGHYVTTNHVESMFNVKSKLKPHRTMKNGDRILNCVLYSEFVLNKKNRSELRKYVRDNIITPEFLQNNVLKGNQTNKKTKENRSKLELIKQALEENKEISIHYRDRRKRHTSRSIMPLELTHNEYDNTNQLTAYCNLREEKRTFYVERIRNITIEEPEPFYLSS